MKQFNRKRELRDRELAKIANRIKEVVSHKQLLSDDEVYLESFKIRIGNIMNIYAQAEQTELAGGIIHSDTWDDIIQELKNYREDLSYFIEFYLDSIREKTNAYNAYRRWGIILGLLAVIRISSLCGLLSPQKEGDWQPFYLEGNTAASTNYLFEYTLSLMIAVLPSNFLLYLTYKKYSEYKGLEELLQEYETPRFLFNRLAECKKLCPDSHESLPLLPLNLRFGEKTP